jgi:hypothetical protein
MFASNGRFNRTRLEETKDFPTALHLVGSRSEQQTFACCGAFGSGVQTVTERPRAASGRREGSEIVSFWSPDRSLAEAVAICPRLATFLMDKQAMLCFASTFLGPPIDNRNCFLTTTITKAVVLESIWLYNILAISSKNRCCCCCLCSRRRGVP